MAERSHISHSPGEPAHRGYTVMEVVVVLVLVVTLLAVAVFSLRGINSDGRANACRNEKGQVRAAVVAFHSRANRYPTDVKQLLRDPTTGKGYLDRAPRWYRRIGSNGTVTDPPLGDACHGI